MINSGFLFWLSSTEWFSPHGFILSNFQMIPMKNLTKDQVNCKFMLCHLTTSPQIYLVSQFMKLQFHLQQLQQKHAAHSLMLQY